MKKIVIYLNDKQFEYYRDRQIKDGKSIAAYILSLIDNLILYT